MHEPAVERVRPRVVRAADRAVRERAAAVGEPRPAVQAGVVEPGDRAGFGAHDDDRVVADRVLEEVARRGELLLATGDLPHARPQPLELEVGELGGGVALLRQEAVGPHEEVVDPGQVHPAPEPVHSFGPRICACDAWPMRESAWSSTSPTCWSAWPTRCPRARPSCATTNGAPTPSSTSAPPGSRTLRAAGVQIGDHVGLYLRNSVAHLEAMLACYKARAVPINVNYRYVADELRYLCDDADLVALFHDADTTEHVEAVDSPTLALTVLAGSDEYEHLVQSGSAERDFGPRSPDDHYVLYTGGTTGRPKGVVWRQEDMFFGGLGSGNPGGPPITAPEQIAASVLDNPRSACGRSSRRATRRSRSSCRSRSAR